MENIKIAMNMPLPKVLTSELTELDLMYSLKIY